jgi:formylglycine-generating enzyme required for sulfatase activity
MKHAALGDRVTRERLIAWYREGRARSEKVFRIPIEKAYYDRPIALRNPIIFYEGHLPAFAVNTLIKLALRQPGIDEEYEVLFARGIDPESEAAVKDPTDLWPRREQVQAYGRVADQMIERALCEARIEDDSVPQLRRAEAALAILEHEQMHQETLLYMFHNLPYERKRDPGLLGGQVARLPGNAATRQLGNHLIAIPPGTATLGADPDDIGFGWDNEFPQMRVDVGAFSIQKHNVTNGEYLEFITATGAKPPHFWAQQHDEWYWRGMFALVPLPLDAPVYVTQDEATAYAKWRGMRLPTEAEYHRAAFGTPSGEERLHPWGNELPDATRGNFDFSNWDPVPVGSYPNGASAWGVHDLVGNGWEWTSTIFAGFPGFEPMPSYPVYSSDFFDGQHYVMKGGSARTAACMLRPSFRNWFQPHYPYVYTGFRCVRNS